VLYEVKLEEVGDETVTDLVSTAFVVTGASKTWFSFLFRTPRKRMACFPPLCPSPIAKL
jgi:hypothetical protein